MMMRIVWAIFLTMVVSVAFGVVWRKEQKVSEGKADEKNSQIWVSPLVLPFLLVLVLILCIFQVGWREGMHLFFCQAADVFLFLSGYFIILLILLPLLRRRISARACATLWLVPAFLFYQAYGLYNNIIIPYRTIYVPLRVLQAGIVIWAAGFVVVMIYQIISHQLLRRHLLKNSREVEDAVVLEVWEEEKQRLCYEDPVRLLYCSAISTPLSMGIWGSLTLLPERMYTKKELSFIFRHELHHMKRRDVQTKIFLGFCKALCWCNPLIWIAVKKASDDLELSCDEIVLAGSGEKDRGEYAELLLQTAGRSGGYTTCLSAAASTLRYRMRSVLHPQKKFAGVAVLAVIMFASCLCYGSLVLTSGRKPAGKVLQEYGVTAEDISHVSGRFTESGDGDGRCGEELFAYLSSINVERIYSARDFYDVGRNGISLYSDKKEIDINMDDSLLLINDFEKNREEAYQIRSGVDWQYIGRLMEDHS